MHEIRAVFFLKIREREREKGNYVKVVTNDCFNIYKNILKIEILKLAKMPFSMLFYFYIFILSWPLSSPIMQLFSHFLVTISTLTLSGFSNPKNLFLFFICVWVWLCIKCYSQVKEIKFVMEICVWVWCIISGINFGF